MSKEFLRCIECSKQYDLYEVRYSCECEGLLEVNRPEPHRTDLKEEFDQRLLSRSRLDRSGVWRFREAVLGLPEESIVSHPEGSTRLYSHDALAKFAGLSILFLKHEGENPTGSFKDRGMTTAVSMAKHLKMKAIACASTGNTSAALAAYAGQAAIRALVILPQGKVATGKLAQTLAYGARCLEVKGDFDEAMRLVQELTQDPEIYMVNSLNPFRLEGQKTIMWEMLQDLEWQAPDWVVVPGGNLGNTSAFGKALVEAYEAGWIAKLPRIAVIQAEGANPFYRSWQNKFEGLTPISAETVATAIRIGNPVNFHKARRVIATLNGVVECVSDVEIATAKKNIDRVGIGCEPASACSLAGIRKLVASGTIDEGHRVVGILTGNILKDPDNALTMCENRPVTIEPTVASVRDQL